MDPVAELILSGRANTVDEAESSTWTSTSTTCFVSSRATSPMKSSAATR